MKSALILCFFALVAVALGRPNEEKYTNKWDGINIPEVLANKKLLEGYLKCILDVHGKCTPEGKELKSHIKEALETNCLKCTDAQRSGTKQVIAHLINHEAKSWDQLKAKYDPTGKFSAQYEKELKTINA